MKTALIHDHLAQDGGAEKVLKIFAGMFPDAKIYTLLADKRNIEKYYKGRQIDTSIIQKLPGGIKHYQWYMPFMPMAVEFFDLGEYDLVLSDTASFAKGVITKPDTLHICYCHTPTRYLWSDTHQYINELKYNKYFKKIISLVLNYIRLWDRQAADRVDVFIANSKIVQKRIKKYYKRDSTIIYPPVETDKFNLSDEHVDTSLEKENYFLVGCRLAPYKRVDIVIKAFKELQDKSLLSKEGQRVVRLKVFGDGIDRKRLEGLADGVTNIEFLGRVDDKKLARLYRNAQGFIHPQEEDFGITAVESMACGTPVIAFRKGGAKETIVEGVTGIFFEKQTKEEIQKAVLDFDKNKFNTREIRDHAKQFSVDKFKKNIKEFIDKKLAQHND